MPLNFSMAKVSHKNQDASQHVCHHWSRNQLLQQSGLFCTLKKVMIIVIIFVCGLCATQFQFSRVVRDAISAFLVSFCFRGQCARTTARHHRNTTTARTQAHRTAHMCMICHHLSCSHLQRMIPLRSIGIQASCQRRAPSRDGFFVAFCSAFYFVASC